MPRKYRRKLGARHYKDYSCDLLQQALLDIQQNGISVRAAAEKYKIPRRSLSNKLKAVHQRPAGGQTALTDAEEQDIIRNLLACADWGMPLDGMDIRILVQQYLNSAGRTVSKFVNNMPGEGWYQSFISRHREHLTVRRCQNISRARSSVGTSQVISYFDHLEQSINGIPASNILNYDETNFSDDPGVKKMVFRRGVKYPERVMNATKGNISVMFAGTGDGQLLPPYVVYRSEHLWSTWVSGGPAGTRYGRSKSGWLDTCNFQEWFRSIIIPWARRLQGPKCIIGDNLSAHISSDVVRQCADFDIRFVLLPPNATHLCQPLDVAFFGPMKKHWRQALTKYKTTQKSGAAFKKSDFPRLLQKLVNESEMKTAENIKAGFKACGIIPLCRHEVLKRLPDTSYIPRISDPSGASETEVLNSSVSNTLLDYLKACRRVQSPTKNQEKRKRLDVMPGRSVSAADLLPAESANKPSTSSDTVTKPSTSVSSGAKRKIDHSYCTGASEGENSKKVRATRSTQNDSSDSDDVDEPIDLFDDDSDDDIPLSTLSKTIPVQMKKRSRNEQTTSYDNCVICGEFGPGNEWWFRCEACGAWAHKACSGVDKADGYKCDFCH